MRNYSFDVLKLFLSLLVVFIHIHVLARFHITTHALRCALLFHDIWFFPI